MESPFIVEKIFSEQVFGKPVVAKSLRCYAEQFQVPGYGRIFWDWNGQRLKCVCDQHENCMFSRTLLANTSGHTRWKDQGRPLGMMLAWLRAAEHYDNTTDHHALSTRTEAANPWISFPLRAEARDWGETLPELNELFFSEPLKERAQRPGEGKEPAGCSY